MKVRSSNGDRLLGMAAVTLTSILWGTTGTVATYARGVSSFAIGAAALGIGGILQAAIAVRPLKNNLTLLLKYKKIWIFGALGVMLYALSFYSSMQYAGVAIGSVISLASAPIFSGLLELMIDRKRLSGWWWIAALLGVAGSILLTVSKMESNPELGAQTVLGIVLGLVAGLTYAGYTWVIATLIGVGAGRAASMGAVLGGGGALLIPILLITGAPLVASITNFAVASYMALVPMFIGYVFFGFGLSKIPASTATTITLSEPAVATILAVVVVGENLQLLGWVGLMLIASVLLILAFAPTNRQDVLASD